MDGPDDQPRGADEAIADAAEAPRRGAVEEELAYRLRQQTLLTGFCLDALRMGDRSDLQHAATRVAAEGLQVGLAKFLLYRARSDDLLVVAGIGWNEGTIGVATLGADADSPAGYAFCSEMPVLSNHLDADPRFRTPALLREHGVRGAINVPVRDGGVPVGILEVDTRAFGRFDDADTSFLEGLGNVLAVALRRLDAEAEVARASARETHLAAELRHRVRNIFTLTRGLVAMSRREAAVDGGDLAGRILGRLDALSAAAEAGLPELNDGVGQGAPADVERLVGKVLAPYAGQIDLRPPDAPVPPLDGDRQTPVALLLHELATNALKHGALSRPDGRVVVSWATDGPDLRVDWRETMPLPADARGFAAPAPGFGTGMIDRLIGATEGRIERAWTPDGLHVRVLLPARD